MVSSFRELLRSINHDTPYYFQSLDGLADLWKIDKTEFNSYRGKDKVLTISCLEGIDMKITALADLYRKMSFDAYHMRELLPENLRFFNVDIRVAEMRKFHKIMDVANPSINTEQVNGNANTETFKHQQFEAISDLISVIVFRLEHCEFDFEDSFPAEDALSVGSDLVMAKQRIKIKVGKIREQNQYKLLDLILQDDRNSTRGGGENSQVGSGGVAAGDNTDSNLKVIPDFDNALNKGTPFNPLTAKANELTSELQKKLERAGGDIIGRATNAVNAALTKAVLGNVYELRNQSLGTIVGSFVGKKEQAQLALGKENVFAGQATTVPSPTSIGNVENPPPRPARPTTLGNAIK